MNPLPKLLVIVGPTAVGKTSLATRLAERMGGEIISADSRYFYVGMDIGTAKPSPDELARVPHHLVNVTNPDNPWSLTVFQEKASLAVQDILQRNKLPILVGGTGQYIRAVIDAWQVPEIPPDQTLRDVLYRWGENLGARNLHARLVRIDSAAASRMDPGNLRRTVRALEVIFSTGRKFSEQSIRSESTFEVLMVGLRRPRLELYKRIDERIDQMIASGFIGEVRGLLGMGINPKLPAMSAIGYREIGYYLAGRLTLNETVMLIKRSTHQYVRRQANWFKEDDATIQWFEMDPDPLEKILHLVQDWMQKTEMRLGSP